MYRYQTHTLAMKKIEHAWKSVIYDGDQVSVHRPGFYSERFERFLFSRGFNRLPMTESLRRYEYYSLSVISHCILLF